MFSGFFGWFLVIVLVVAIFSADRLPELKQFFEKMSKEGIDAVKKGTKTVEEKIAKAKAEKNKKADSKDDSSEQ